MPSPRCSMCLVQTNGFNTTFIKPWMSHNDSKWLAITFTIIIIVVFQLVGGNDHSQRKHDDRPWYLWVGVSKTEESTNVWSLGFKQADLLPYLQTRQSHQVKQHPHISPCILLTFGSQKPLQVFWLVTICYHVYIYLRSSSKYCLLL